jgi:hypothetical protein
VTVKKNKEVLQVLIVPVLAIVLFFVIFVIPMRRAYSPVSPEHLAAIRRAHELAASENTDALISAYVSRARRYRTTCSLAGLLASIVGVAAFRSEFRISTDMLMFWLAGYLVGGFLCDTYNLRPKFRGNTEVTLEVRSVSRFATSQLHKWTRAITALTVLISLIQGVFGDHARVRSLVIALVAVLALVASEMCQRAIAFRWRPTLPPDLLAADDAVRTIGIESLRRGGLAFGVLLLAWQIGGIPLDVKGATVPAVLVFAVLFIVSLVLTVQSRRAFWPVGAQPA